jgi:hypothetical protein
MSSNPYSFRNGVVQDRNTTRVLAQIDEIVDQGGTLTSSMEWERANGTWSAFDYHWTAHRIAIQRRADELFIFEMGPQGHIGWATSKGDAEEDIDPVEGAGRSGDFLDLQVIGSQVYACGMSRQVYRRDGDHHWVRVDQGVVQPPG